MLRYRLAAKFLRLASHNAHTTRLYRLIANAIGSHRRSHGKMPSYYASNIRWTLKTLPQSSETLNILEIGTGWMHWESVCLALFFPSKGTLFDVWDNRQIAALKNYLKQFQLVYHQWPELSRDQKERADDYILKIQSLNTFDQLYTLLNFNYVVEPTGELRSIPSNSHNIIVSARVLEHIPKDYCQDLASECYRILTPRGSSIHSISIGDHLYQYDLSTSPKQYLTFSSETWQTRYENKIQYINRIQKSQWLQLFENAGFRLESATSSTVTIDGLSIAPEYKHLSMDDLQTDTLKIHHVK